nr:SBBP repeat-containing protein [Gemmatimonadota bacterium]
MSHIRSLYAPSLWALTATLLALVLPADAAPTGHAADRDTTGPATVASTYASLPMGFEAASAVPGSAADFIARGSGYAVALSGSGATLALRPSAERPTILSIRLQGSDAAARVSAIDELPGRTHYLIGNQPSAWRLDVPSFARVRYSGVYPGVDVVYYGNQRNLEYDFVVAPGADPRAVRLTVDGAEGLELDRGDLVVHTTAGDLRQLRPVLYQHVDGARRKVAGEYVLENGEVGFRVGAYDRSRPLVIDPALSYSTFLGGATGGELGESIAVDGSGNAYVTGETFSTDFVLVTPLLCCSIAPGGGSDGFVTKVNAAGTAFAYSTYLGGNDRDHGRGITVDGSGSAYVVGSTASTNFPTSVGAAQTVKGTGATRDAFVTKLSANGQSIVYSTYAGGARGDIGNRIALDASNNAYFTGYTESNNYPVTAGVYQPAPADSNATGLNRRDPFVTKLNAGGTAFVYSTYLGGTKRDEGADIAVSGQNAYVTGLTASTNYDLAAAFDGSFGGVLDAFVTGLNATGTGLV